MPINSAPTQTISQQQPPKNKSIGKTHHIVFGLISLVVLMALVGGVYEWQHKKVESLNQQLISENLLQGKLDNEVSTLLKEVANKDTSTTTISPSPSTHYLTITQIGIKIPLTNTISDATYTWVSDGPNYYVAKVYSKALAQFEVTNAPECSSAVNVDQGELLGTVDEGGSTDGDNTTNTITIGKSVFHLVMPQDGYGCSSETTAQMNTINQKVESYSSALESSFQSAVLTSS